jgi:hypothetical protein
MLELAAIIALLVFARRLRRLTHQPPTIRIDVFVHYPGGPGEQRPVEEPLREEKVGNVVPFRQRLRHTA